MPPTLETDEKTIDDALTALIHARVELVQAKSRTRAAAAPLLSALNDAHNPRPLRVALRERHANLARRLDDRRRSRRAWWRKILRLDEPVQKESP